MNPLPRITQSAIPKWQMKNEKSTNGKCAEPNISECSSGSPHEALDNPGLHLHGFKRFRNEGSYLMGLFTAASERLVEREVR